MSARVLSTAAARLAFLLVLSTVATRLKTPERKKKEEKLAKETKEKERVPAVHVAAPVVDSSSSAASSSSSSSGAAAATSATEKACAHSKSKALPVAAVLPVVQPASQTGGSVLAQAPSPGK